MLAAMAAGVGCSCEMEGLLTLEVEYWFYPSSQYTKAEVKAIWKDYILRPLWKVKGLRRWVVKVNWQEADLGLEGAPFHLQRLV